MVDLVILTPVLGDPAQILPVLGLLPHHLRALPLEPSSLVSAPQSSVVLIDARRDLLMARTVSRLARSTALGVPVLLVLAEGALAAVAAEWGADDFVVDTASPGEVEARLRILSTSRSRLSGEPAAEISAGELSIDESSYSVRLRGIPIDLTYKEFELLRYLVRNPGRVFTRAQLLQEVWGYDYYGGTRTVDVHVRRLRAKLGPEHEQLIGTVRNVGYLFAAPTSGPSNTPGHLTEFPGPQPVGSVK